MKKMKLKLKVVKVSLMALLMGLVLTGATFILKDNKSNAFNAVGSGQESYTQTISPIQNKWSKYMWEYDVLRDVIDSDYFTTGGSSDIIKISVSTGNVNVSNTDSPGVRFTIKQELNNWTDARISNATRSRTKKINHEGGERLAYGGWTFNNIVYNSDDARNEGVFDVDPGKTTTVYVSPDKTKEGWSVRHVYIKIIPRRVGNNNPFANCSWVTQTCAKPHFPGATVTFTRTHIPW